MKGYTGVLENGEAIHYVDRKRWLWLLSVSFPLQALMPVVLHAYTGNELWFFLPLLLNYLVHPALDAVIGTDANNPPEEVVMQLEQDRFYRRLTYIVVPLHFFILIVCAVYAGTQGLSWWAFILLAIVAGLTAGLAINTAHELGHKNTRIEKAFAKFALAVPFYGHFTIDHNRGHHMLVSTPEDEASARMGESIYRFALREIPGAFRRSWEIERERLRSRSLPVWHYSNPILQSYAISVAVTILLLVWAGWLAIPFLVLHHVFAYWQLTSANYIEHYGLLRQKNAKGRYERCQPHHSWNCNYLFSNLVLFHLERHSDHHANPLRRYQSLRHYEDVPQLPNGYFGMYVLAYVPPLWFRVMDERLMALPHVNG
ncbi:MAG: alkane 1-monooxygenase, partial [Holophagales bacterium]|nr:alkane 1-monooxygenase [Holophagales bacterium]